MRTNTLLIEIMLSEEKLYFAEKSNITLFFNGVSIRGKIISDNEYYKLKANAKFKSIYEEYIKIPREPYIQKYKETKELNGFPEHLRQSFLHLLSDSGPSIQIRIADIVGFSFD